MGAWLTPLNSAFLHPCGWCRTQVRELSLGMALFTCFAHSEKLNKWWLLLLLLNTKQCNGFISYIVKMTQDQQCHSLGKWGRETTKRPGGRRWGEGTALYLDCGDYYVTLCFFKVHRTRHQEQPYCMPSYHTSKSFNQSIQLALIKTNPPTNIDILTSFISKNKEKSMA